MSLQTDLDQLKAQVSEKFDQYCLILMKDGQVVSTYSSNVCALGMTKMVHDDIEYEMQLNREEQLEPCEEEEDE